MNRFSFRAWIKGVQNCMHYSDDAGVDSLVDWVNRYDGSALMQSTGLMDKNGKEIFEGDILVTSNDGKDGCDVWTKKDYGYTAVVWDEEWTCFTATNWVWVKDYEEESVFELKYIEVVGNIYENPELLKEMENDTDD